ncbi:MAG: leucine-rich repeat protein [Paludibacteraceae bacterium]|nr:leucine-rich repeat protein [Paludibacteraceae bacterium]
MKKIYTFLLAIAANVSMLNAETQIGDLYYNLDADNLTAEVTYQEPESSDNYSGLTSITIPNSVTSIGGSAFSGCSSLISVYNYAATPQAIYSNVFYELNLSTCTLYVPEESIELYRAADVWKEFGSIIAIPSTEVETEEYNINYLNKSGNVIDSELVTLSLPAAPEIEGFTFLRWDVIAGQLVDGINIQAVYTADEPTSAPEVVNPVNKSQKLIRNGNVYILRDGKTYTVQGQEVR